MAQKAIEGWDILMIHEVPMGCVLNAENAKDYPLRECGSWISKSRNWLLQHNYNNEEYELIPNNDKATRAFYNNYSRINTTMNIINSIVKDLDKEIENYGKPA